VPADPGAVKAWRRSGRWLPCAGMIGRWLRIGVWLGLLGGLALAVVKVLRPRPGSPLLDLGRPAPQPRVEHWPPLEAAVPTPQPVEVHEAKLDPDVPWVAPHDGLCPDTHPVKANAQSRIYHVPGGLSYARTVPQRCYISTDAAEADGFRPAKR
jgi:hypothetical protein